MNTIAWLLLISAFLPYVATVIAKAGGSRFDNGNPRAWLANQQGFRARANAAQNNLFESLPFFFGAVLFALHQQADANALRNAMIAWIVTRIAYIACYLANIATLRSLIWVASLALTIHILSLAA